MSEYQPANLENLFVKRAGKRMRVASCDPTGGNNDNVLIPSGETYLFADLQGPGIVTHFFCTIGNPNKRRPECGIGTEEFNVRKVVLNVYWDDETEPSIQAPLGDFFGMGHGITKSFSSAPLQITPEDGRGFNCWFPMPFRRRARFTVKNECCSPLHFYFYVDYEQVDSLPENALYFHALWNRECPTDGIPSSARSRHMEWIMGGEQDKHLSAEGNYVLLDAEGSGQYVGCNINIHNLENSSEWDWFGEGDDAILIDDEPWPPRLHGTGMEDYLGLAWCPTQEYHALYNGCTLSPMDNYKGMASYYRFHILDPIMFDKHIRVTFEHGHNNNRSDDWSTTAYWYQTEPHKPFHPMLPVEQRLPIDQKLYEWTGRREFCKNEENVR